jgi:hypothetical protein
MIAKLAVWVINSALVVKYMRPVGWWISRHRAKLGIEFDGEWCMWMTKPDYDAKMRRKAEFRRYMGA